jgi:hypothetical protein
MIEHDPVQKITNMLRKANIDHFKLRTKALYLGLNVPLANIT